MTTEASRSADLSSSYDLLLRKMVGRPALFAFLPKNVALLKRPETISINWERVSSRDIESASPARQPDRPCSGPRVSSPDSTRNLSPGYPDAHLLPTRTLPGRRLLQRAHLASRSDAWKS